MSYFPLERPSRAPRISFVENIPAVVRSREGCRKGKLQTVSVTGGLLQLSRPVERGAPVKVMFLIRDGSVLGIAEMLSPLTWGLQPFKFLKLYADDECRLQTAIEASLQSGYYRMQMERYRAW